MFCFVVNVVLKVVVVGGSASVYKFQIFYFPRLASVYEIFVSQQFELYTVFVQNQLRVFCFAFELCCFVLALTLLFFFETVSFLGVS